MKIRWVIRGEQKVLQYYDPESYDSNRRQWGLWIDAPTVTEE